MKSDHETSTLKSKAIVSCGLGDSSGGELTKKSGGELEPQGMAGEPAKKLFESTQLGGVGATTIIYGTPKQDTYHSLSTGKVVCADGNISTYGGTNSVEKAGNTSIQEKQFKGRSKASANVHSVGVSSKSKSDVKSASARYYGTSKSHSHSTTDRVLKATPLTSGSGQRSNKGSAKVEAVGNGRHMHRRVEQKRSSKPAPSVTSSGRLDVSKRHWLVEAWLKLSVCLTLQFLVYTKFH